MEDVIEAIELQAAGAQDLKTSIASPGFVHQRPSVPLAAKETHE